MDIGVVLLRSFAGRPGDLGLVARAAEQLGYHSAWVTEHTVIPVEIRSRYPYSPDGRPPFGHDTDWAEAMVTLGFVAAVTTRIRLGTAVIPMLTRSPIAMAKQAATVDVLSSGRLELGLGAGWLTEEAEILGHPHDHRGARLDEAIDIMRKAWARPSFSHQGRFWRIPEVGVHPHPPQGAELPVWIGGTSPAAVRTSAERAVGNLMWLSEPDEVAAMRARLPGDRRVAAAMRLDFRGGGLGPRARALRDAGADLLILVAYRDAEPTVADLERFAAEVAPAL
jgi:probable F420-dependent oxidoreductase